MVRSDIRERPLERFRISLRSIRATRLIETAHMATEILSRQTWASHRLFLLTLCCALVSVTLLGGCSGPHWTTLESDLGDGIIDQTLVRLGSLSDDVKTTADAVEKYALENLAKAGYLSSSDSLRKYLAHLGMSCTETFDIENACRISRYKIERLKSGGAEDGVYRIDWQVTVTWIDNENPINPRIRLNRTTRRENP